MYISKISIKNFKSIRSLDLHLSKGKNVLVGKNNAGKSNILKAIDLVIGEADPSWNKKDNITENDFHNKDVSKPIVIFLTLTREMSNQIPESLDFLNNLNGSVCYFPSTDTETLNNYPLVFQSAFPEREPSGQKIWIGDKTYCRGGDFKNFFTNAQEIILGFFAQYDEDKDLKKAIALCKKDYNANTYQILSAVGTLRKAFIESAIIPAFRNPQDQLKTSTWAWFGKLIHHHINQKKTELYNAFSSVKKVSDELFHSMKEDIDKNANVAFPNTTFNFQFNPEMDPRDIAKGMMIYVDDGFNSRLDEKGSGIQSYMIITLFDYYIHNIASINSGALLALEEPELFLHPHARRVLSDRINDFLSKKANNQVILTTHSSDFISDHDPYLNLIVVHKQNGETKAQNIDASSIKMKQILLHKENAEMFFADMVILTEDLKLFIESTARQLSTLTHAGTNWLNAYNISVLNCGGKREFPKYASLLTQAAIPFCIIADFDFLGDGLNSYFTIIKKSSVELDKLNALKSKISALSSAKKITDIPKEYQEEIREYLQHLVEDFHVFLLPGELEDLYKQKPSFNKAQGVLETINQSIEQNRPISDFITTEILEEILQKIATTMGIISSTTSDSN